jgi:hypothetical protein
MQTKYATTTKMDPTSPPAAKAANIFSNTMWEGEIVKMPGIVGCERDDPNFMCAYVQCTRAYVQCTPLSIGYVFGKASYAYGLSVHISNI